MRRFFGFLLAMIFVFSFCFVFSGLTQETKEKEGVYTIQKGDTLWDISSKFLKDPFLWPKLWQKNPYITNPHWIYPGNTVRLTDLELASKEGSQKEGTEKEGAQKVAAEKPPEPAQEAGVKEPEAKKPEVEKAESPAPPTVEKVAEVIPETKPEAKPAPVEKPVYFREARSGGFMSNIEYRGIGIVLESREGKNMMSEGDVLYLALRTGESIAIGNKYTVFRAGEEIRHPVTNKRIGRKYNIIGNVRLIDQHENFFAAKVIECFDAIMRGDYIQPYSKEKMEGPSAK